MKKSSPGKLGRSSSMLVIHTAADLRRAFDDLLLAVDRDLDNNNWNSVEQAWASFDNVVQVLPTELDQELLQLLPSFAPRAVESLCSHKSVSTTVVTLVEDLAKKLGTAMGPFLKTLLPGFENLLIRAGLLTHGPGGRAVERLVALAPMAPFHEILPWISGLFEKESFTKNTVARERGMKVAIAFAKELIVEESRKPGDLRAAENIVKIACTDASVLVRDGAKEMWALVKEHQSPEKIKAFLAQLSDRGREMLTPKSPATPGPVATPRRVVSGNMNRPLSAVPSRQQLLSTPVSATPKSALPRITTSLATPRPVSVAGSVTTSPKLPKTTTTKPAPIKNPQPSEVDVDALALDFSNVTIPKSRLPQPTRKASAPGTPISAPTTAPSDAMAFSPSSHVSNWSRSSAAALSPRSAEEAMSPHSGAPPIPSANKSTNSKPTSATPGPKPPSKTPSLSSIPSSARSSRANLASPAVSAVRASAWALSPGRSDSSTSVGLAQKYNSKIRGPSTLSIGGSKSNMFDNALADLNSLIANSGHQS